MPVIRSQFHPPFLLRNAHLQTLLPVISRRKTRLPYERQRLELADGARTLAAVSAEAILKSVEHLPAQPKLWIVCGGGVRLHISASGSRPRTESNRRRQP